MKAAVFRCEPDGSHLELFCHGLRNPQELAFDDHGNLFTGDNDCDQGDQERWVYLVEGGDYGWRVGWQHPPLGKAHNPWLAEKLWVPQFEGQAAYILPPIANIPDGPSGVAHYPGTGLAARYDDHFFVCGFKGTSARSAISSWVVKPQRRGLHARRAARLRRRLPGDRRGLRTGQQALLHRMGRGLGRAPDAGAFSASSMPPRIVEPQVAEVQQLLGGELKQKVPRRIGAICSSTPISASASRPSGRSRTMPEGERCCAMRRSRRRAWVGAATGAAAWHLGSRHHRAPGGIPDAGRGREDRRTAAAAARGRGSGSARPGRAGARRIARRRGLRWAHQECCGVEDERVSFFAAQALGQLGRREALPQLLLMIREAGTSRSVPAPRLRHGAAWA